MLKGPAFSTSVRLSPQKARSSIGWTIAALHKYRWIYIASCLRGTRSAVSGGSGDNTLTKTQIPGTSRASGTFTSRGQLRTILGTLLLRTADETINVCRLSTILTDATTIGKSTPSTNQPCSTCTCILCPDTRINGGCNRSGGDRFGDCDGVSLEKAP